MKYLLIMTVSENVINFRSSLIKFLLSKGHDVTVVAHDDHRAADIENLGVTFHCVKQDNRGLNPFAILGYFKKMIQVIKNERPDVIFTYQMKPNIFGAISGWLCGVRRIYPMVEGVGDVYTNTGLKWRCIRLVTDVLYRISLLVVRKVFFLNNDDKEEFLRRKLTKKEKCLVVHGIGVDLEKFSYTPTKNERTFLMAARMLKTKGIYEYCKCARIVKQKYPDAVFGYLGAEATVKLSDIQEYIDDGSIAYYGTTQDVRPYLAEATAVLLPSYREGCPVSIMEAEAMGCAVVVSNSVGCRDTVLDGYNGFIVKKRDHEAMAEKVIWCIEHPEETKQMGINARAFAEERFNAENINEVVYEVSNENITSAGVQSVFRG